MSKYKVWIKENYGDLRRALGQCKEACNAMKRAFPELRVTNGFVEVAMYSQDLEHWWCVDTNGNVVDPTIVQYGFVMEYKEIDDKHPARNYPRHKCMNCGSYYYAVPELKGVLHNEACEREFTEYLNG